MKQYQQRGNITGKWIKQHAQYVQNQNPPQWVPLPKEIEYLRIYFQELAYIGPKKAEDKDDTYKQNVYKTLYSAKFHINVTLPIRVQEKHPHSNWTTIWKNINKLFLPTITRTTWYMVVHDIVPTNERLHKIKLHDTGECKDCRKKDTILHRYTECARAQGIWAWTKQRIAYILRTSTIEVKNEWICLPDYNIYPPQRHNAVIWLIGHMIGYIHNNETPTRQDYMDFLRRARKKIYSTHKRPSYCGKYLDIIDY